MCFLRIFWVDDVTSGHYPPSFRWLKDFPAVEFLLDLCKGDVAYLGTLGLCRHKVR